MAVSEEAIREALREVIDPELFVNVIDLGLIYLVQTEPMDAAPPEATPPGAAAGVEGAAGVGSAAGVESAATAGAAQERVKIEMTLTSPACPAGPQLIQGAKSAVGRLDGVGAVEVKLVMSPPWSPDRMTEAARDQLGIF
jgi:metal-sulfur cluster biosynthetic enzyme